MDEIIKMTNEVFVDSFEMEEEQLTEDATIFDDLGLDSLDMVDMVVALQKKFNVKIRDDERVRNIRTLGDVYRYIELLRDEGVTSDTSA
ncbi:MAG: acyl carrier protein [Kiritimatiellae bacterium]|nr:acyl carrier protein [Kiritimatiellia bacterium]